MLIEVEIMRAIKKTMTLHNGVKIPLIGFGTWQISENEVEDAVLEAIKVGYRHIDTAHSYGNEKGVGRAIKKSGIPREQLFITTKLPSHIKTYDEAKVYLKESFENLDVDYIDLILIHAPWPWSDVGKNCDEGNKEVWRHFEELYEQGLVKSIGVSNFSVHDLENIMQDSQVVPHVNQIAFHIGHVKSDVVEFCNEHDILIQAYSPLATGRLLNHQTLKDMADKYNVTVAQLAIRYCIEKDTLPLPKSVTPKYIYENTLVDFKIDELDLKILDEIKL